MFHGRKHTSAISRWLLCAVVALLMSGIGLVVVPGAGATKGGNQVGNSNDTGTDGVDNGGGNNCTNEGKGNGGEPDKAQGSGEDKNCTGGGGGGTTGPTGPTGSTGSTGATGSTGSSGSNDGNGGSDGNNGSSDNGSSNGNGSSNDTSGSSDASGSNDASGPNGPAGPGGVTTTTPSLGIIEIKGAMSASHRKSLACTSLRHFRIRIRHPHGEYLVSAVVRFHGKVIKTIRGNRITSIVNLRGLPRGTDTITITAVTNTGRILHGKRTYHTCAAKRRHTVPKL